MNRKVKIAILDTGIDRSHEYLKDNIIGGIGFNYDDKYILRTNNYDDDNGHGTACASVIKNEFLDVELFIVKILDKQGKANIQILEEALKYILNTNIRLINLSLSVMRSENVAGLYKVCEELTKKGKIIVSSLANGFEESYPAIFDNVIGVKGFILEDENTFWYNRNENIQCIIDNNPYLSCHINNSYKLFGKCNSQATAKFTGKIAEILSNEPDISLIELHGKLEILARNNNWTDLDFKKSKRYPNCKENLYKNNNMNFIETINTVKEVLDISLIDKSLLKQSLFNSCIGLTYENCFELIKSLERKFNICFEYKSISRYDLWSIYTLTQLVEKNLK